MKKLFGNVQTLRAAPLHHDSPAPAIRHPLPSDMPHTTTPEPQPPHETPPARRPARLRTTLSEVQQALAQCQQDLADCQAREAGALRLAAHDALTGLPNRRAFVQQSGRALQQHAKAAHVFCLLFIDLDGFKAVNDELGHAAGDALLQVVGERLQHGMRRDDFVCRLGGDEFVCLLPNLQSTAQARVLADKLLQAITAPCRLGRMTVTVGATVGAAIFPRDGHNLTSLLAHADRAMRKAKLHKPLRQRGAAAALSAPAGRPPVGARPA
jgi:diguanylate cyclase (GGDEF)-like protein